MITGDSVLWEADAHSAVIEPGAAAAILLLSGAYDIEPVDLEGEFGWLVRRYPVSARTSIGSD